jgi:hypothetical protein
VRFIVRRSTSCTWLRETANGSSIPSARPLQRAMDLAVLGVGDDRPRGRNGGNGCEDGAAVQAGVTSVPALRAHQTSATASKAAWATWRS